MKIWIPIHKEYGPIAQAKELIHTAVGVKEPDVYDRCSYRSGGGGMRIDSWKIICLAIADTVWLVLEKSIIKGACVNGFALFQDLKISRVFLCPSHG